MLKKNKKNTQQTVQQVLPERTKSASSKFHPHIITDFIKTDKINIEIIAE